MSKQSAQDKQSSETALVEAFANDVNSIESYISTLLPWKGSVERFRQMTHLAIIRKPGLLNCNRKSLLLALIYAASKGLEPECDDGAWMIPFLDKSTNQLMVTPVAAYKGIIKVAKESESVKDVQAFAVYSKDLFEYGLGMEPFIEHKPPKLGDDRGDMIGAYAIYVLPDGMKRFHVMDMKGVHTIRDRSFAWRKNPNTGPWEEWPEPMTLKTVVKQGFRLIPVTSKFRELLAEDGRLEAGASVAQLIKEGGGNLPPGWESTEIPEPEGEPDTTAFDDLVVKKNPQLMTAQEVADLQAHLNEFLEETGAGQKPKKSAAIMKLRAAAAASSFETMWEAFQEWEPKRYPKQDPKQEKPKEEKKPKDPEPDTEWGPEPTGHGGQPAAGQPKTATVDPTVKLFEERRSELWALAVTKGVSRGELQGVGVVTMADITPESIDALEELVKNKPDPVRGKK